jgi:hypothetical protein
MNVYEIKSYGVLSHWWLSEGGRQRKRYHVGGSEAEIVQLFGIVEARKPS